jgi:DNA (cytosine-5)-methyltransferase 1
VAAYYNEWDRKTAAWLRELIKQKLIADGEVDERSITEVSADDVRGFDQAHFFAGIGGWSYSLRLAGIPDDYPVWTASLPCQPFSAAGKKLGKSDERHLLPYYLELVRQCRPKLQIGEQVEGAIRHGWLDDLQTTMEAEGYAVGAAVLGAHSVGAPHIRQRLYWGARTNKVGMEFSEGKQMGIPRQSRERREASDWGITNWIECRDNKRRPIKSEIQRLAHGIPSRVVRLRGYGNAIVPPLAAEFIRAYMDIYEYD